jgi:hypothetical protein
MGDVQKYGRVSVLEDPRLTDTDGKPAKVPQLTEEGKQKLSDYKEDQ